MMPSFVYRPRYRGEGRYRGFFVREIREMKNGNGNQDDTVKVDYIIAWAMWKTKAGVSNIASKFGKCPATIYNWVNRVEKLVAERLDMEKLKNATILCFPSALESLVYNLEVKKDPSVTNNFLNKSVFADVKETEVNVETNVYNLNDLLGGISNGDLKHRAEKLAGRTDRIHEEGASRFRNNAIEG